MWVGFMVCLLGHIIPAPTGAEGPFGAARNGVQRARHHLLARAALALDQHRGARVGHLVEEFSHMARGRAGPDEVILRLIELVGEPVALALQRPLLEGLRERGLELLSLEGLVQVVAPLHVGVKDPLAVVRRDASPHISPGRVARRCRFVL
jgi:hypothetical protein